MFAIFKYFFDSQDPKEKKKNMNKKNGENINFVLLKVQMILTFLYVTKYFLNIKINHLNLKEKKISTKFQWKSAIRSSNFIY